jgi:hypothetical protein
MDEEPENWFGNVSLPLFPREKAKGAAVWLPSRLVGSSILKIS